jgi:hypothetical protein
MRIAVREKKRNWSLDCIMTTSTTKIKRYSTPSQALGYSLSLDQLTTPMGQFGLQLSLRIVYDAPLCEPRVNIHHLDVFILFDVIPWSGVVLCPNDCYTQ